MGILKTIVSKLNLSSMLVCYRTRKIVIRCTKAFADALRSRYQGDDFFHGVEALGQGNGYYHLYPRSWDLNTKNPLSTIVIQCILENAAHELQKLWSRMQDADFTASPVKTVSETQVHNGGAEVVVAGRVSTAQRFNMRPTHVIIKKSLTAAANAAIEIADKFKSTEHKPVITLKRNAAPSGALAALMQRFGKVAT